MSSREFSEWLAYFNLEPFGEDVEDNRAGVIAAMIVNTQRGKKTKAVQPADFFPRLRPPAVEQTPATLLEKVKLLHAAFGGDDPPPTALKD